MKRISIEKIESISPPMMDKVFIKEVESELRKTLPGINIGISGWITIDNGGIGYFGFGYDKDVSDRFFSFFEETYDTITVEQMAKIFLKGYKEHILEKMQAIE